MESGRWSRGQSPNPRGKGVWVLVLSLAAFSHLKRERRWLTYGVSCVVFRSMFWVQRNSSGLEGKYRCAHLFENMVHGIITVLHPVPAALFGRTKSYLRRGHQDAYIITQGSISPEPSSSQLHPRSGSPCCWSLLGQHLESARCCRTGCLWTSCCRGM